MLIHVLSIIIRSEKCKMTHKIKVPQKIIERKWLCWCVNSKCRKMKCETVHSEIHKDEQFYHKQIFEEDNIIKKRFRRIVIRGKPLLYLDVLWHLSAFDHLALLEEFRYSSLCINVDVHLIWNTYLTYFYGIYSTVYENLMNN